MSNWTLNLPCDSTKELHGANHDDLQRMNRVLVLSFIRKHGVTTRADLSKLTGLKRATISNIINDLIACGIVKETGFIEGNKGRRSIGVAFNGVKNKIIAIRLSRAYFIISVYDIAGGQHYYKQVPVSFADGADITLNRIKEGIHNVLAQHKKIATIGIALPGPYIKSENEIGQISDFPGWEGINIVKEIEQEFNIPTCAEHDGKASALAEWWFGNHTTFSSNTVLMSVLAGHGTGIGIISKGEIFQGANGCAGELGHTSIKYDGPLCACGNRGCLDLYCSSLIYLKILREKLPQHPNSVLHGNNITFESAKNALLKSDPFAVEELKKMGTMFAYGLVNAINVYDPNIIVIGDDFGRLGGQLLLDTVKETVKERILPSIYKNLSITMSALEDSILLGAMVVATDMALLALLEK